MQQFIERRPVFQAQQNFGQQSAQELFFLSGATSFTVDGIMADVVLYFGEIPQAIASRDDPQSITVKYGEWLVKDPAGTLRVVSQADMKTQYEQVK